MKVFYTKRSIKDLNSLSKKLQKRIAKKMRFYLSQDNPLDYAKKLKDKELGDFRFRVGDYRISFDMIDGDIYILKIKHRRESY